MQKFYPKLMPIYLTGSYISRNMIIGKFVCSFFMKSEELHNLICLN